MVERAKDRKRETSDLYPRVGMAPSPAGARRAAARHQLKQARILLVDDEAANLGVLRRVLEQAGYSRLMETSDPLEAATIFSSFQPDLVCLDLHMSPLDGFGVLAELELDALCWNVVPTHPGTETSNRRPTRLEILASRPFLEELAESRRLVAVGRLAASATAAPYIRHPSHGGAAEFRAGLLQFCAGGRPSPPFP